MKLGGDRNITGITETYFKNTEKITFSISVKARSYNYFVYEEYNISVFLY